ncbi:MAG: chromosomal replication initiator protein DnaA [Elusimicrobia bacterium]|nr:chromosomal replication initiator protein DnaA [Elusimicrobiota bacterium]
MDNLTDIKYIWEELLKKLAPEIGSEAVDLWIRPIKPLFMEENTLRLEVPDSIIYNTVKQRYEEKILPLLASLTGKDLKLNYSMSLIPTEPIPQQKASPASVALPANYFSFNPNYTFESFIMGPSNRFAVASAEGVSKTPGQTNPFFIYSPPGLGKTHLLHAIAHGIFKLNPAARILYTASENFVNEYIDAVRGGATEQFRNKYRKLDCLLLDDIQFLVDKERSEEEFFYTFNSLFESKKQIVVTSDRPPRELALGQRLISRFLSGVVADIKIPDFETRVAILRQKRDNHNYDIPDDIITFIAENVKKSIRELDGCLITVGNFCSNMKIQPSIDAVKEIIKDHISDPEQDDRKISVETIKNVVSDKYNIEMKDFNSKKRNENIAFPRQVAMYMACSLTEMSLNDIGDAFGRDHATVLYAKNKIGQMVQTDPYFNETLNQMITKIKNVSN